MLKIFNENATETCGAGKIAVLIKASNFSMCGSKGSWYTRARGYHIGRAWSKSVTLAANKL